MVIPLLANQDLTPMLSQSRFDAYAGCTRMGIPTSLLTGVFSDILESKSVESFLGASPWGLGAGIAPPVIHRNWIQKYPTLYFPILLAK